MKTTQSQQGFTLIEIMVVVVILGILAALIAPNILGRTGEARITAAKSDINSIGNALDLYKLDNFAYPSTDQGLEALVNKPSGYPEPVNWNADGYLKSLPKDPWGNEYQYVSPGRNGPYDLYSLGADKREGGEGENADISN
ncbi:MAG: type II secretion system major pseudopilin GspG [Gammaproteobacteria bacterium]|uniref:type II secretion system major pseudopilin GspG n=1 Tax=Pseudomaricurvus alcaniphilus TaxID=1166482 RepID=UPI00140AD007|nr:type II secretion system major pseudopilin GspG [Pseudomaricurvus alcaniphilus]MBR9912694.1 type II secretion system major pseudopilin GspG [Gammaproteobacteria bacterium]NHN38928.1 type II secretion system major pseudopilin GspG [Pseudomaricurvus alcaniphilus]